MATLLNITAPIFLLIFIGYLAVKTDLIPQPALVAMSRFVLYLALPSLIFTKLSDMYFAQVIDLQFLSVYAAGCLGMFVFGVFIFRYLLKERSDLSGIKALGCSLPNNAFVGFPVMMQFFDSPPTQAFAMVLMVENILLFPIALAFIESVQGEEGTRLSLRFWLSISQRVMTNPIILAVIAGVIFSFFKVTLPDFMVNGMSMLAAGSAPVALIIIGGSLVGTSIRNDLSAMALVSALKLVLHPLLVAVMVIVLFPQMAFPLKQAVVLFAASPMLSVYPIIGGRYGFQAFCSGTLLLGTVLAFVSISTVLSLISYL